MLVTVAEAKAHIPALTSASTADDAFLTTLIGRVDGIFARRTGRPGSAPSMEARTYRLDLAAQSGRELDLEVYPVCSVTSAYVDATGDFEGDEETVTVSDIGVRDATTARLVSTSSSSWSTSPIWSPAVTSKYSRGQRKIRTAAWLRCACLRAAN